MNQAEVLVGNISEEATVDDIKTVFCEGQDGIVSLLCPLNKKTGKLAGYAYVRLLNSVAAERIIHQLDGTDIAGRHVTLTQVESERAKRPWYHFGM